MFSSSVAGAGSICLGCQLRAVTRRATPGLAASAAAHTPTPIRRRRYASDSDESARSNDDFFTAVLNEKRYDDGYEASGAKKKKASAYKVKSKRQRQTFADSFNNQTSREPSPFYSEQELGFEDVWDQDPDLGKENTAPRATLGNSDGKSDPAPVEPDTGEIDYGASTNESSLHLDNYSWNAASAAELRQQFADRKYRPPKKSQPQPEQPPPVLSSDLPKTTRTKSTERRPDKNSGWDKVMSKKSLVKNTDNLYDWSEENTTPPESRNGDIELDLGEGNSTPSQEPRPEESQQSVMKELEKPKIKHYRGNTILVEDLPQLSVETLGQDAPVIVLREHGRRRQRNLAQDKTPIDSGLNIEDYADQEEGLSLDIILENIDGLRPEHRILPAREFKIVFDILMKGFTTVHLEAYIQRNRQRLAEGDETPFLGVIPDEPVSFPWIVSQSRWIPEVEDAVEDVADPLKGYILKTMPPKQRLAMQLMRESWGMSVQELLYGQGVLDVQLRDLEFQVLTLGDQRFLQVISRVHLMKGGGKSLQIIKSRKALQIIAPKVVAEACLMAIDEKLQMIRTKSVTMDRLPVKNLSSEMLEELGRITNSLVQANEARREIDVTWVDFAERYNSKVEDTSDIILRLILSAYPPSRISTQLTVYPDPAEQGRLIEDMGNKDKLPWNDRRIAWARLCLPLSNKAKSLQLSKHWPLSESMLKYKIEPVTDDLIEHTSAIEPKKRAFFTSLAGVPLGFPRSALESEEEQLKQVVQPTKPTPSGWLPFRARTGAIFGHVLHLNNKYISASIKESTDAVSTSRRTFSPLLPPVLGLHLPAWVPYRVPKYMSCSIVMRFTPTSITPSPSSPNGPAPTLELCIKATDEEIIGIDYLRATTHTHVSDICLPGDHVDVRVKQRLTADIAGDKLDKAEGMQPLMQFLKDAYLEVGQGRLVTPPVLDGLGLPSWMFYAPETDAQSPFLRAHALAKLNDANETASAPEGSKPKKTSKTAAKTRVPPAAPAAHHPYEPAANALVPTSYIFSGLEVHRASETSYDGWKLLYTSVEAGAGGGRRAELELEAVPAVDKEVRREGSRVDAGAFLRSMYKLATGQMAKGKKGEEGLEDVEESEKALNLVKWVLEKR